MLNILKAILRQTLRDKLLLGGAAYVLITVVIQVVADSSILRGTGSESVGDLAMLLAILLPIAAGTVTARACGTDLRDKTANYEILFGKKRSEVYFGRFLAALTVMFAVTLLVPLMTISVMTLANGWGGSISVSDALLHWGLIFPMTFRIVCFYTALTFFAGNDLVPLAISIIGTMVLLVMSFLLAESGFEMTWHTAATDLTTLLDFSNRTEGFLDGADIIVYKVSLSGGTVLRMLCTSFGIGLCWLFGGLAAFRRRDIS